MENKTFLEKLKFGIGDGNLQYYLYNWKCPIMGADKVMYIVAAWWKTRISKISFFHEQEKLFFLKKTAL